MMTTPPIVGVPRLVKCAVGPSWRMNWPYCRRTSHRMNSGVPNRAMTIASPPEISSALTGGPPPRAGPRPTTRAPAPAPATSTTSPSSSSSASHSRASATSSHVHRLGVPGALLVGAGVDGPGRAADGRQPLDVQAHREPSQGIELDDAHRSERHPDHGDPPPVHGRAAQGAHRPRPGPSIVGSPVTSRTVSGPTSTGPSAARAAVSSSAGSTGPRRPSAARRGRRHGRCSGGTPRRSPGSARAPCR